MLGTMLLAAALSATNANSCVATPPSASREEVGNVLVHDAGGGVATQTASTNMPPRMVSVWKQAQRELRLTSVRQADGTLDAAAAARRREAVVRAFVRVCRNKGIPEAEIAHWQEKIR